MLCGRQLQLMLLNIGVRRLSSSNVNNVHRCKLLIVGGGAGGCTVGAKLSNKFQKGEIVIVDPADYHYNQSMFTMVGGGLKKLADSRMSMASVLPKNVTWIKDSAVEFAPHQNSITTKNGSTIHYDFMLVGVGFELNYDKIEGLVDALEMPNGSVCSNYSPKYAGKTFECLGKFQSGNAIFTYPNSPVKCPGAPQKACYISEDYFARKNMKDRVKVVYNSSLPVIFGVKKYADALWKVVEQRNIDVNLRTHLVSIEPGRNEAVFENLDTGRQERMDFEMLHVAPPMSTPAALRTSDLVNPAGFVEVDKGTLQSTKFANVFAIGDCSDSPNSKTAAACAAQSGVVAQNILAVMDGKKASKSYNGYASCPLVTGINKCILAEFDYDLTPLETFPFNQAKERLSMYMMKKHMMPIVYKLMLEGYWGGPAMLRKLAHFGLG